VTDELTPSQTMNLNTKHIKGIITAVGSNTSHSAILANHLGIPAVSGIDIKTIPDNALAIIDGKTGDVILEPDITLLTEYKIKQSELLNQKRRYLSVKHKLAQTKDEHRVKVYANVGDLKDLDQAVANRFKTSDVVIRTLDIGGDKNLSYMNNRNELNPFLGNRAIRYSLSYPSLFKTQLRAILKANQHHNIQVMFPMIATLEEFRQAKSLLLEAKADLEKE